MPVSEKVSFTGATGETLAGRYDAPISKPRAYALFAHCFSCSKDIFAAQRIAQRLVDHGIAVLRFDFTGLGLSEGDFANTNFSSNVGDLVAAANWMAETHGNVDLLIGHSLGGAAVVVGASQMPGVKAIATLGAPSDADHVLHNFATHLDEIEERGEAIVTLAGRPFTIKRQFVEDVRGASVRDAAAALKRPFLVMHSPIDDTVGIDNATGLFVSAKHPKSFISLDNADHLIRGKPHARYAADVIASWASRYIFEDGEEQPPQAERGSRAVVVEETGRGRYENWVVIGDHHFFVDEPQEVGGGGRGPDPYELLNASLGACTSMTIRMYADRKSIPLDTVSVTVRQSKDYAEDCEHCEEGEKVDIFERDIRLSGDLDAQQHAKLIEIADKCPVHRTLHGEVVIRTTAK